MRYGEVNCCYYFWDDGAKGVKWGRRGIRGKEEGERKKDGDGGGMMELMTMRRREDLGRIGEVVCCVLGWRWDGEGSEVVGRMCGWTLERCICWGKEKKMAGSSGNPTGNEGEP